MDIRKVWDGKEFKILAFYKALCQPITIFTSVLRERERKREREREREIERERQREIDRERDRQTDR